MAVPEIIYGTRIQVFIQPYGATGQAASTADNFSAQIREISMTGGERNVEEIKTLGNNEILRQNPQEPMDVELTMIRTDPRVSEAVLGGSDTQFKWDAGSFPFIVNGDDTRRTWRVWIESSRENDDDWAERLLWNNAYGVNLEKDVDAEGFIEETITFRCKAQDYVEEWTGSYTTNVLSTLPSY